MSTPIYSIDGGGAVSLLTIVDTISPTQKMILSELSVFGQPTRNGAQPSSEGALKFIVWEYDTNVIPAIQLLMRRWEIEETSYRGIWG